MFIGVVMSDQQLVDKIEKARHIVNNIKEYSEKELCEFTLPDYPEQGISGYTAEQYCNLLNALSYAMSHRALFNEMLFYGNRALDLARKLENQQLQSSAFSRIGNAYLNLEEYDKAEEYFNYTMQIDEQVGNTEGIIGTLSNIGNIYVRRAEYQTALEKYKQGLDLSYKIGSTKYSANILSNMGAAAFFLSDIEQSLNYFNQAVELDKKNGPRPDTGKLYGNIGSIYYTQGDYAAALENYSYALNYFTEAGNMHEVMLWLGNSGSVYQAIGMYSTALEYMMKALQLSAERNNKGTLATYHCNVANIFFRLGDLDKAKEYSKQAVQIGKEYNEYYALINSLANMGAVAAKQSDFGEAIAYVNESLEISIKTGNLDSQAKNYIKLSELYSALQQYEQALQHLEQAEIISQGIQTGRSLKADCLLCRANLLSNTKTSYYDPEQAMKQYKLALTENLEMNRKTELAETHKFMAELYEQQQNWQEYAIHLKEYYSIENELRSSQVRLHAEVLSIEKKEKERENQLALEKARNEATQSLLHNILPPTIAIRMLGNPGAVIADHYDSVSILFADIVNFTGLSQKISPDMIVRGLNHIFSAFDELALEYGAEKIKTIGDSYMVVTGVPEISVNHVHTMARLALAINDKVKEFEPLNVDIPLQLRIGIHTGSVVAGVIGKNKFLYDLWGDAVNTASRMESHGEPGRIHVSEEFAQKLTGNLTLRQAQYTAQSLSQGEGFSFPLGEGRDGVSFSFPLGEGRDGVSFSFPLGEGRNGVLIPRGEIEIKGKGRMRTYFIEKE
jgi:class 3 adenylate cyclase/uncharacterized protein HemY